jgi:flavin reductase (DIM6/NTAB) family NADH-FMN oxidoreductase RutF
MAAAKAGEKAFKLMHLQQVFLLTSAHKGGKKPHVIPQLWAMPVSFSPELVAIAVANSRYSRVLIGESGEFVLNLPGEEIAGKVWACAPPGEGRDKFKRAGLSIAKARKVKAPIVKECLAAIECRVVKEFPAGDHTVFVGRVLATRKMGAGRFMINAPGRHEFGI